MRQTLAALSPTLLSPGIHLQIYWNREILLEQQDSQNWQGRTKYFRKAGCRHHGCIINKLCRVPGRRWKGRGNYGRGRRCVPWLLRYHMVYEGVLRAEMLWWVMTRKQCRWSYCSHPRIQPTDSYRASLLPLFPGSIYKMSVFHLSLVIFSQTVPFSLQIRAV